MPTSTRRLLPWVALLTIYVVWGSTYMAIALVVRELPPFAGACARFLVAGALMSLVALVVDRRSGWPSRRQWLDYAFVGLLFLGIGNGLVMWAEQRIPSGIAALLVATVPLWITLLDGLRPGGQEWTLRAWLSALLGLAGVALVARPGRGGMGGHWGGIVALQVACVSWSIGSLYSQSLPRKLPVFSASAIEMLAGALALLVQSLVLGEDLSGLAAASPRAYLALGYLVVFGSLIGFTAFAYCLEVMPASTVSTYAYVNPVVAVALGAVFLSEPLSAGLVGGALLIVAAVILTSRAPRRR